MILVDGDTRDKRVLSSLPKIKSNVLVTYRHFVPLVFSGFRWCREETSYDLYFNGGVSVQLFAVRQLARHALAHVLDDSSF